MDIISGLTDSKKGKIYAGQQMVKVIFLTPEWMLVVVEKLDCVIQTRIECTTMLILIQDYQQVSSILLSEDSLR